MSQYADQVVQYIPRLRRYARALLKDADRAEDLVQETLTRALGKLHFWRRGSDMRAWLFTLMHNQFVNDCRRMQKRPDARSMDDAGVQEPVAACRAEQCVGLRDIENALMQLSDAQREVLLLVSLEGLSYAETAKVLHIKQGTVMSRLHRAREQLRYLVSDKPVNNVTAIRRVK